MSIRSHQNSTFAVAAAGGGFLAATIFLISLNLRTPVASVGPVLRDIIGYGLSPLGASVLTTLPSLCFGLAAFAAAASARALGLERALLASLALLTLGTAVRGGGGLALLFLGQIIACGGIGLANAFLPSLVKRQFGIRAPLVTGIYTMGLGAGAAAAAGATVPLTHTLGGWPAALGSWAVPVIVAAAAWVFFLPSRAHTAALPRFTVSGLWRDPVAWHVTLFMGLQSSLAYIVFGWLPPILRDRGMSATDAGLALSLTVAVQAAAALFAPVFATRRRDQSGVILALMAICLVGLLGAIYAPLASVWVWAVLLGVAQGALFALALTVIVLRAGDSHVAASLSGMAQGVGYLLASTGPLLTGVLHGWTGNWHAAAGFMVLLVAAGAAAGFGAGRDRIVAASSAQVPRVAE